MNKITKLARITITLVIMLMSVISWGQEPKTDPTPTLSLLDPSSDYDAETNPYVIESAVDWETLVADVSGGYTYSDKVIKLTSNIPNATEVEAGTTYVSTMVGTTSNKFQGHIDGNNKTLYFTYDGTGIVDVPVAPFQYTQAAEFEDLTVEGTITLIDGETTDYYGASGLIGYNYETGTVVTNVLVSVDLDCEGAFSDHCGGFAVDGRGVSFEECVYRGELQIGYDPMSLHNGGFCGLGDANTSFNNCLCMDDGSWYCGQNFAYYESSIGTINNCYYSYGDYNNTSTQGTKAYVDVYNTMTPIVGKETTILGIDVYTDRNFEITNVDEEYILSTGDELDIPYLVTYDDGINAITEGACYAALKKVNAVGDSTDMSFPIIMPDETEANYCLIIKGVHTDGKYYYGKKTKTFTLRKGTFGAWSDLKNEIENGTEDVVLDKYYKAGIGDGPITIDRDVVIDLNGFYIDRNLSSATTNGQVIIVNSGKTVTIKDTSEDHKGLITGGYNKAASEIQHNGNNDGGGIRNLGNLTLQNITISGNRCEKKKNGTSYAGRGGGIYSWKTGDNESSLIMENVTVKDNEAQGGGGGIFVEETAVVSINGCTIRSNHSYDKGGGIRIKTCGETTIENTQIAYNVLDNSGVNSAANGGGIHTEGCTVNLENCQITQNISSKFGGGIYIMSGSVNATNCNISYNRCYDEDGLFNSRGGGVYIYAGTFKMNGGTITGNNSKMANGGGVFVNAYKSDNAASFHVEGNVHIYDNYKFDANGYQDPTPTNVFLAGKTNNDVIYIDGDLEDNEGNKAEIWVSKNGGSGAITKGLSGNGDISQFKSDEGYTVYSSGSETGLSDPAVWNGTTMSGVAQPTTGNFKISKPVIVNAQLSNVSSVSFANDGCIILVNGGYLATNVIIDPSDEKKNNRVVVYGGELVTTSSIPAVVKKDIEWATSSGENWYLISSAINTPNIIQNTNLLTVAGVNEETGEVINEYDLYRFNESVPLQWENYRAHNSGEGANFTTLDNGRGYLYRNKNNYTIAFSGTLNTTSVTTPTLTYTGEESYVLRGFNIIGNPYPHKIKKGTEVGEVHYAIPNGDLLETNYYVLSLDGTWLSTDDGTEISPFEGILVQAKEEGELTINKVSVPAALSKVDSDTKSANDNIWFTIANNKYQDRACVEFCEGHGLNKMAHLNEKAPMLYINYNGEDFASADVNPDAKAVNLNFEAKSTSMFTLKCSANGEFSYLHLYDKVAGRDIDLLNDGEYSFIGSPNDNKDRFVVRLSETVTDSQGNTIFAYQSGNDIIVDGQGELQVFDMMGRLIATQYIDGVGTWRAASVQQGVYILRLNEMSQKIVVR